MTTTWTEPEAEPEIMGDIPDEMFPDDSIPDYITDPITDDQREILYTFNFTDFDIETAQFSSKIWGETILNFNAQQAAYQAAKDYGLFTAKPFSSAFLPRSPREAIVENLLYAGNVAVFFGDAGSKKSISINDLGVCVALGAPWLKFQTKQGRVLWIDEDNGEDETLERLERSGRGHNVTDAPLEFISMAGIDAGNKKQMADLERKIADDDIKLVVIDAWQDVIGGRDEDKSNEMQPLLANLRNIAERTKCVIIIIHHANKAKGYRGSTALKGKVDLMIEVTAQGDNINFTVEKARQKSPGNFSAIVKFETDKTYLLENSIQDQMSPPKEYILRWLFDHPDASKKQLTDNAPANIAPRTVTNNLGELEKYNHAKRTDTNGAGGAGKIATYGLDKKGLDYVHKHYCTFDGIAYTLR